MTSFWKKLVDNWQDTFSLVLGLWLIVSPWVLQFTGTPAAQWNAVVFGIVIALMAVMALVDFHEWEEWADMAIGAWLIVAPWLLGFAATEAAAGATGGAYAATWNSVAVGILALGMAAWSLFDHRHRAHA